MELEAVIIGLGLIAFLSLYACFQISKERILEKSLLYFVGLSQIMVIPFILFSESLEVGSAIGYLSPFFEKFFMISIFAFAAVIAVFMLHILETRLNVFGGKDGEE